MTEATKKTEATKLRANKAFIVEGRQVVGREIVTMGEAAYIAELDKGWHSGEGHNGKPGFKPMSPYINHCDVVSCSNKSKDAYQSFLDKKGK